MKFAIILASLLMLSGCVTVSIKREFPKLPPSLETNCAELDIIPENTDKLSQVLAIVTANYGKYHQCQLKVIAWQEWYKAQKQIFDQVQ